jgi:hypothetical protein
VGELIARWADERSFQVLFKGDTSRVIVSSNAPLHLTGDALLAFLLPIAMATWSRLIIEDEVDEWLMRSQTRIQEILSFWQPLKLKRVNVDAPIVRREPRPNVSSFFSGGVDSTYSALQNRDEITRLVLVHGFDTRVEQVSLRADISDRLSRAADTLGIPLVEISTTVRDLSDRFFGWVIYHGGALAGVAHMLDTGVCLFPAAYTYADSFQGGSHPLLDPLWGSGAVQVEHDGGNVSRVEKIAAIAHDPDALGWLRVCYKNPDQKYNCGRCEKCVRTMLTLHALGVLEQAPTFPNSISPRAVRNLRFKNNLSLAFVKENVTILEGRHRRALRAARRASVRRLTVRRLLSRKLSWAKPSMRSMRFRMGVPRSSRLHT